MGGFEIEVRISEDIQRKLGIDVDSIFDVFFDGECLHVKMLSDEELEALMEAECHEYCNEEYTCNRRPACGMNWECSSCPFADDCDNAEMEVTR